MPSHNPYEYIPADRPRIINWPKIILLGIGIGLLIAIIVFFILDPLSKVSEEADNLLNQTQNQEDNVNDNNSAGSSDNNTYDCSSDVYNCGNFTTQSEAQYVFDLCGPGDIHQLDADGNGEACESLL